MSAFQRDMTVPEFEEWRRQGSHKTPLSGNLEKVDESSLTKAKPSDLVVGNDYLLVDNNTNEKTKGKFIRTSATFDNYNEVDSFEYYFKDKKGEFLIEGYNDEDKTENINPFDDDAEFDDDVSVFIPKSKQIIQKKLEDIIPEDMAKETVSNLGGKSKKRKMKTRTTKKRTTKKRKGKKQTSNKRRTHK